MRILIWSSNLLLFYFLYLYLLTLFCRPRFRLPTDPFEGFPECLGQAGPLGPLPDPLRTTTPRCWTFLPFVAPVPVALEPPHSCWKVELWWKRPRQYWAALMEQVHRCLKYSTKLTTENPSPLWPQSRGPFNTAYKVSSINNVRTNGAFFFTPSPLSSFMSFTKLVTPLVRLLFMNDP